MKNKSMIQSVLMVIFVLGVMVGSFSMEGITNSFTTEQFLNLAKTVGGVMAEIYPPSMLLNSAIVEYNALSLILFVLFSVALIALTVFIVTKNYSGIIRRLLSFNAKHNYKIGKMSSHSITNALYLRESKRYFSSSIYVTNTIIGPVLGTIMSVALCVVGIESIESSLPFSINIPDIFPFAFSAVFCTMTTTSVAISMEGKQFWVIKSLPISTKALFDSKIFFNLSLMLPFYAVSQVAFTIALKPTVLELLWQILIPLSLMTFVSVFGIAVNIKLHSFDWEKEETVVKQSASAALGGFAGFFLSAILGVAVLFLPVGFGDLARGIICVILWLITALIYRSNNKCSLIDL